MKLKAILLILILIIVSSLLSTLNDELEEILSNHQVIGSSIYVINNDQEFLNFSYGMADRARNIPVTQQTKYRIASISKSITATAVMQLHEQGLIDIYDDANNYLDFNLRNPNFPDYVITIEQLMTHTSSLRDGYGYSNFLGHVYGTSNPPALSELLLPTGQYYSSNIWSSIYTPGDANGWDYCNLASGILAGIVELASGTHFHLYCEENIFSEINGEIVFNNLWDLSDIDQLSVLYRWENSIAVPQADNYNGIAPTNLNYEQLPLGHNGLVHSPQGGVRSSAEDLGKFMQMHMSNGFYNTIQMLNEETVTDMHSAHWRGFGLGGFYTAKGLNFHITQDLIENNVMIGHAGEAYGLISDMYFDQDYNFGIIFIINGGNYSSGHFTFYDLEEEVFAKIFHHISNETENDEIPVASTFRVFPNPFYSTSHKEMRIKLPNRNSSVTSIQIFNAKGQIINSMNISNQNAISWDLKDSNNQEISSGVYFVRFSERGKIVGSNKFLYLK
jgi:CubicO group peptidase (beta-lactamase class C family)